jgi:hypothetical protein
VSVFIGSSVALLILLLIVQVNPNLLKVSAQDHENHNLLFFLPKIYMKFHISGQILFYFFFKKIYIYLLDPIGPRVPHQRVRPVCITCRLLFFLFIIN